MKGIGWRVMVILVVLTAAAAGAGSIYKWVDEEGVVHYSDRAPEDSSVQGDIETRESVTSRPSPETPEDKGARPPASAQPPPPETSPKNADVEIYTTRWCRYCKDAKRYFQSRGIRYREYDIERDRTAARRHKRYNPRGGVPVTVINGRAIVGYAPAAFARALRNS
jgi:glutaredoxin-like YruB-family protein